MDNSEKMSDLFDRSQILDDLSQHLWLCFVFGVMKRHATKTDVEIIEDALRGHEKGGKIEGV